MSDLKRKLMRFFRHYNETSQPSGPKLLKSIGGAEGDRTPDLMIASLKQIVSFRLPRVPIRSYLLECSTSLLWLYAGQYSLVWRSWHTTGTQELLSSKR